MATHPKSYPLLRVVTPNLFLFLNEKEKENIARMPLKWVKIANHYLCLEPLHNDQSFVQLEDILHLESTSLTFGGILRGQTKDLIQKNVPLLLRIQISTL